MSLPLDHFDLEFVDILKYLWHDHDCSIMEIDVPDGTYAIMAENYYHNDDSFVQQEKLMESTSKFEDKTAKWDKVELIHIMKTKNADDTIQNEYIGSYYFK